MTAPAPPHPSPSLPLNRDKIVKLIQSEGMLASAFKGFEPRLQQQQMMTNVIEAYNHDKIALIEAGTGTGKSLAYLIPALIWASRQQERTVISTNTITLQEQLLSKDIPALTKALDLKLKAVLVKGMNNYICLRKLQDAQTELRLFPGEDNGEVDRIDLWSHSAKEGSRTELPFVPSPATWERVGAEHEACPLNECPHYQQCFFVKARREAQDANILVVNHHLLFSDIVKRADTDKYDDTCILPPYKRVVLDEAHHIEEIATEFLASRLHRIELLRVLGRLASDRTSGAGLGKLPILKDKIQTVYNKTPPQDVVGIIRRLTIDLPALRHNLNEQLHEAFDTFAQFIQYFKVPFNGVSQEDSQTQTEQKLRILGQHQSHFKWNEEVKPHAEKLINLLKEYHQGLRSIEADLKAIENDRLNEQTKGVRFDIQALASRLDSAIGLLGNFLQECETSKVRWIELQPLKTLINVHLVDAHLDVSEALASVLFSKFSTIILCSATLSTNQQFNFVRQRLGLTEKLLPGRVITENIYDSPFDYQKQAALAIPTDMPPPNHPDFNAAAFENIWRAIEASHGQAFVLFTSYTMLKSCYASLEKRLADRRYPVFKQGDDNRQTLLQKFKTTPRAVLFGTDSFWEGVDVAGDALRCVIIVKLPFKVPTEPMTEARTEAIVANGGDPFFEYSVPHAIVKFKQGFGRLIRHKWDRGCIICLDTRLVTKGYGRLFLNSLPPCEKMFMQGSMLWPKVEEFYRKTYYFVKNNPFS